MSIAISTVLKPPIVMVALLRTMCGGIFFLACAVSLNLGVELDLPTRIAVTAVCLIASVYGLYFSVGLVKTFHISICSDGRVTLRYITPSGKNLLELPVSLSGDHAFPVKLVTGTTLWPQLMMLGLRLPDSKTVMIGVTHGSVGEGDFRRLAVACKWILLRNDPAQGRES